MRYIIVVGNVRSVDVPGKSLSEDPSSDSFKPNRCRVISNAFFHRTGRVLERSDDTSDFSGFNALKDPYLFLIAGLIVVIDETIDISLNCSGPVFHSTKVFGFGSSFNFRSF